MSAPSIIFFSLFVLPLVAALIWLMRKDKRKGMIGLIVLVLLIIGAVAASVFVASKSAMENARLRNEQAKELEKEQGND